MASTIRSNNNHHHHGHFYHHQSNPESIEIKSKFDAEFRRFSLEKSKVNNFESFHRSLESFHKLQDVPFSIFYTDPNLGDLLPINNDENYAKAISVSRPLLRLILQRKGESWEHLNSFRRKHQPFFGISSLLPAVSPSKHRLSIGLPEDFRQVSQIIDVDILPDTCRRVRLVKHGSDKPLGFYIRDGTSVRVTPHGLEKVPGIFISRLVPGGLAEGTGLLAVNDEVLEVNGIEVNGKTLDQVTDMMVANSSNLIITIRPATQRSLPLPTSYSTSFRSGSRGSGSKDSRQSHEEEEDSDDDDEIKDHLSPSAPQNNGNGIAKRNGSSSKGNNTCLMETSLGKELPHHSTIVTVAANSTASQEDEEMDEVVTF